MRTVLAARAAELAADRTAFVQATVVRAQHPTSAHAGDGALVLPDGSIEGFVGGTCAESSVRVHALAVLETREPLLLRILPGEPSTRIEQGAVTVSNPCLSGGALEIFLEPRTPPPRVVVVGDSPIAQALAALGEPLGLAVTLTPAMTDPPRPDDAALVVASHGRGEEAALEAALRAGVPYVGLVASRARGAAVLAALDVPEALRDRVHTPAGLAIGARTGPEIALSILAEIVAQRAAPSAPVAEVATAVDPICGMTVAVTADALQVDGVYFCGEGCRAAHAASR